MLHYRLFSVPVNAPQDETRELNKFLNGNRIMHHLIINKIKNLQVGLIISFNTLKVKHGIKSLMNNYLEPSASSAVKKP